MSQASFYQNVVVITGASLGIGRELAHQLAAQGAWLSLAARGADQLKVTADQCEQLGGRVITVPTDVADSTQCKQLIEQTVDAFGRIDTLINNAGVGMLANFEDVEDPSILAHIMQVNYMGSVYCTYFALPYLKRTKGRLVGISSLAGRTGVPTRSGYAASKHAMTGFFDSLRIELERYPVSVTMIYPGFVATGIRKRNFGANGKPLGKDPIEETGMMTVEECARISLKAIAKVQREEVMTLRGKLGPWMKLIAPRLVDRLARNASKIKE
jgi:short-subunit dehydrogenase